MPAHTLAGVGSLLPISGTSSQTWFWTLSLCNLFLFHLHTPEGILDTRTKRRTRSSCLIHHQLPVQEVCSDSAVRWDVNELFIRCDASPPRSELPQWSTWVAPWPNKQVQTTLIMQSRLIINCDVIQVRRRRPGGICVRPREETNRFFHIKLCCFCAGWAPF